MGARAALRLLRTRRRRGPDDGPAARGLARQSPDGGRIRRPAEGGPAPPPAGVRAGGRRTLSGRGRRRRSVPALPVLLGRRRHHHRDQDRRHPGPAAVRDDPDRPRRARRRTRPALRRHRQDAGAPQHRVSREARTYHFAAATRRRAGREIGRPPAGLPRACVSIIPPDGWDISEEKRCRARAIRRHHPHPPSLRRPLRRQHLAAGEDEGAPGQRQRPARVRRR